MNNIGHITTNITDNSRSKIKDPANIGDLEAIAAKIVRKILQEWIERSEGILAKPQARGIIFPPG